MTTKVTSCLMTCGEFFDYGSNKKRLDRLLVFFQQYMFLKEMLPLEVGRHPARR